MICKQIIAVILFAGLSVASAQGANVEWNSIVCGESQLYNPWLYMYTSQVGTALEVWALADSNLESANTFVQAMKGDVVNESYIENRSSWFAYAKYGPENYGTAHADYSILISQDASVYLAFRVETYDHGNPTAMAPPTYGWVELGLDGGGNLTALRSAWDLDGAPLMVGAIPEPSSALLLIVGGAVLGLRRRIRRKGRWFADD